MGNENGIEGEQQPFVTAHNDFKIKKCRPGFQGDPFQFFEHFFNQGQPFGIVQKQKGPKEILKEMSVNCCIECKKQIKNFGPSCFSRCLSKNLKEMPGFQHNCMVENYPKAKGLCKKECSSVYGNMEDCQECLKADQCDVPFNICQFYDSEKDRELYEKEKKRRANESEPFRAYKRRHGIFVNPKKHLHEEEEEQKQQQPNQRQFNY